MRSHEAITALAVEAKTENWNDHERQAMFSSLLK